MAWAAPRTEALLAFYDGCEGTYRQRMWRLVRGRLATSALLYAAYCGTQLAQPLLLRGAVRAVQDADPDGWAYALAIGANVVLASLCKEQQLWTQMRLGAELRALSVALVYRRAMALRESAVPRGLSNLFGNDCQKLLDVMPLLHLVWAAPALIASAAALLVWLAGWAALAGIVLLSLSLPLNVRIVRATKAARAAQVPIADERVARAGEMVKGMRTLKLNSWDAGFEASVGALRERAALDSRAAPADGLADGDDDRVAAARHRARPPRHRRRAARAAAHRRARLPRALADVDHSLSAHVPG